MSTITGPWLHLQDEDEAIKELGLIYNRMLLVLFQAAVKPLDDSPLSPGEWPEE